MDVVRVEAEKDIEGLIKALKHQDEDVRKAAATALGQIGDARAVEPLIDEVKYKGRWQDRYIRKAAATALGQIGDARAVEHLIQALQDVHFRVEDILETGETMDWNLEVREATAEALGKIGDARAIEPLIEALKDKRHPAHWSLHQATVEALGKIGDARAIEPLTKAALKDKDADVRKAARKALNKIRAKQS